MNKWQLLVIRFSSQNIGMLAFAEWQLCGRIRNGRLFTAKVGPPAFVQPETGSRPTILDGDRQLRPMKVRAGGWAALVRRTHASDCILTNFFLHLGLTNLCL